MISAEIGGREFLLGLYWYDLLDEAHPNREIAQRLREHDNAQWGVSMRVDGPGGLIWSIGVVPGSTSLGKGKHYSLAGTVARQESKALVVFPIDEELWWGCAIADGAVMRNGDFYGDAASVAEKARGFLSQDPDMPLCGQDLETLGLASYDPRALDTYLAEESALQPVTKIKPGLYRSAFRAAAAVAILGVAGYFVFQWLSPAPPAQPSGPTPAQRARMQLHAYLGQVDQQVYANLPPDTTWVRTLAAQLDAPAYPLFFHGWRLVGAQCSMAVSGCSFIWHAYGPGRLHALATRIGVPYNAFQVDIDGTTAKVKIAFSAMHPPVHPRPVHATRARLQHLADKASIANQWAESMRALHLKDPSLQWSGGAVNKVNSLGPTPPGLPAQLLVGKVAAKGSSLYTLHRVLEQADRLGLRPVVYNYASTTGKKAGWKVEFKYVAKS